MHNITRLVLGFLGFRVCRLVNGLWLGREGVGVGRQCTGYFGGLVGFGGCMGLTRTMEDGWYGGVGDHVVVEWGMQVILCTCRSDVFIVWERFMRRDLCQERLTLSGLRLENRSQHPGLNQLECDVFSAVGLHGLHFELKNSSIPSVLIKKCYKDKLKGNEQLFM